MGAMLLEIKLKHSAVMEEFEASPSALKYGTLELEKSMSGFYVKKSTEFYRNGQRYES